MRKLGLVLWLSLRHQLFSIVDLINILDSVARQRNRTGPNLFLFTGRPPGPEMKNCVDRESYSLTAGLALGLVVLGSGSGSDLANIPDTLHYYMIGGTPRPFSGAQKDKYKSPR